MKVRTMWKPAALGAAVAVTMTMTMAAQVASAAPVLTFEFINSGQVVSPTDKVEVFGRVTNTGDEALVNGLGFGSYAAPEQIFNQYWDQFPSTLQTTPGGLLSLDVGASIQWRLVEYEPFPFKPVPGDVGDPVLPGTYVLPASAFGPMKFSIIPVTGGFVDIPVNLSAAADFTWTVRDPGGAIVPTPAAGFAGAALLTLCVSRRRRPETSCSAS